MLHFKNGSRIKIFIFPCVFKGKQYFGLGIMAVMEWYNMVTNMVIIGVYGKIRKNVGYP